MITLPDIPQTVNLKCNQANVYDLNYIINAINKIRTDNGLEELTADERLSTSAHNKANDMKARNYWSHTDPDGKKPWKLIKDAGYRYTDAGENMAKDLDNLNSVEKWIASPSHLKNILDPKFKNVGLGEVDNFKVMHFGAEKKK